MIVPPQGWSWRHAGDAALLFREGMPGAGRVRYVERCRPVRRVASVIDDAISDAGISPTGVHVVDRFVTDEGEHAAMASIRGTRDEQVFDLHVGVVVCDDHYARLEGVVTTESPEQCVAFARMIRSLITQDAHLLGERPRRFFYDPPTDWLPWQRGTRCDWHAPTYPRDPAVISVWPAMPNLRVSARDWLAMLAGQHGGHLVSDTVPTLSARRHGLSGRVVHTTATMAAGPRIERYAAVLEDAHYIYPLALETSGDDHGDAFAVLEQILWSIEPVPTAKVRAPHARAFHHWTM